MPLLEMNERLERDQQETRDGAMADGLTYTKVNVKKFVTNRRRPTKYTRQVSWPLYH